MRKLNDVIEALPAQRRAAVRARGREQVAEEASLRELRQALQISQQRLATVMGTTQASISKMEKRSDMLVSSVRNYVEAIGGTLELLVKVNETKVELTLGLPFSMTDAEDREASGVPA